MRKLVLSMTTVLLSLLIANNLFAQFEYSYPMNGAKNEFPLTHIILRNGALMDASSITADKVKLTGSISGNVAANVVLAADGKTVCITPAVPFAYTENVLLEVKDGFKTQDGVALSGTTINFSIRRQATAEELQQLQAYQSTHDEEGNLLNDPDRQSTYVPAPESNTRGTQFPFALIYTNNNPAPGEIFFHRNSATNPKGYGIMENNGDSVFFRSSSYDGSNFHINLNGYLTALRWNFGVDTSTIVMDSSYNIIDDVHCKDGLAPSQHDQLFMPDGTKWFTIYDWQQGWDLSPYGGNASSTVNVSWIQELDANNNVIFEWRSDQHFQITDAASDILATIGASTFDPWHVNTLFMDNDGNLIAGFRNMDITIKLKPSNAQILWYWGYNTNYFPLITFVNDPNGGFSHPHNIHRIANGHILMMDNGNLHNPQASQPKEYTLDETNYTATCVWYYSHPQVNGFNMFTKQQGSVERMSNGNTFIGYGLPTIAGLPNGTEIDANKNIVWEFRFKDSTEYSYRLYKDSWSPNVGIANIHNDVKEFSVFPTPSTGDVTMVIDFAYSAMATIDVINLLGQKVYSTTSPLHSGSNNVQLDLEKLAPGYYTAEVYTDHSKMVGRIVLQ